MNTYSSISTVVMAALRGGAGKTFITASVVAALKRRGLGLAVFKKGPDYIDAGWLGLAAKSDCYNLDTYLMDPEIVRRSFLRRSAGKQAAVVEGNRGLFDGVNVGGTYSTAELAKLLGSPVVLIVDATKITRTAAALVLGCQAMDPDLVIGGVILNRVGGARHNRVLRDSIERATSLPVLGSVPKIATANFPQRHLGLLPLQEHPLAAEFIEKAAEVAEQHVDLDALLKVGSRAAAPGAVEIQEERPQSPIRGERLRIGVIRDSAFQFYYPENLEAIVEGGGDPVEISALEDRELGDLDALYIGGGFPETHAERLAENEAFRRSVLERARSGLPIYAECGGLMYLCSSLKIDDNVYPMAGVFPIDTVLERQPRGLGYIHVRVDGPNPFYPVGAELMGHEFHYSHVQGLERLTGNCAFTVVRGHGMDGVRDGISVFNALGTYMHVHALSQPLWAKGLLARAAEYHRRRKAISDAPQANS